MNTETDYDYDQHNDAVIEAFHNSQYDRQQEIEEAIRQIYAKYDPIMDEHAKTLSQLAPDKWVFDEKDMSIVNPYYKALSDDMQNLIDNHHNVCSSRTSQIHYMCFIERIQVRELKVDVLEQALLHLHDQTRNVYVCGANMNKSLEFIRDKYRNKFELAVGYTRCTITIDCARRMLTHMLDYAKRDALLTHYIEYNDYTKELKWTDKLSSPTVFRKNVIRVPDRDVYHVVVFGELVELDPVQEYGYDEYSQEEEKEDVEPYMSFELTRMEWLDCSYEEAREQFRQYKRQLASNQDSDSDSDQPLEKVVALVHLTKGSTATQTFTRGRVIHNLVF